MSNSASRNRLAVLLLLMLQHRFNHGKYKRLFTGRSIFPECFYLPDGTDFIFFQFVLKKIIRRDFQSLANVYEYRQAGHFHDNADRADNNCTLQAKLCAKWGRCPLLAPQEKAVCAPVGAHTAFSCFQPSGCIG